MMNRVVDEVARGLPPGQPEGQLPVGDFVLASPLAGWGAKQWPLDYYSALAERLRRECGLPLVINAPRLIRIQGAEFVRPDLLIR